MIGNINHYSAILILTDVTVLFSNLNIRIFSLSKSEQFSLNFKQDWSNSDIKVHYNSTMMSQQKYFIVLINKRIGLSFSQDKSLQ